MRVGIVSSGGFAWVFQHVPDVIQALLSPAQIDQRPNHDPDHVSKKTGTGDGDLQKIAFAGDTETSDVPDLIGIFLVAGSIEGSEIMPSQKQNRPFSHQIDIQLIETLIGSAIQEDVIFTDVDEIFIRFLFDAVARMEGFAHFFDFHHMDVFGQQGIEGILQAVKIHLLINIEVKDLSIGMDPGIGTGRHNDADLPGEDLFHHIFDDILDRQGIDLGLESGIIKTVISDGHFVSHR